MLHPDVEKRLLYLAAPAKPSLAQLQRLFEGWDRTFAALQIPVDRQMAEFDAVLRARLRAGSISIVAEGL